MKSATPLSILSLVMYTLNLFLPIHAMTLHYRSGLATVINKGTSRLVIQYQQPDNGFGGGHLLRNMQETIDPGEADKFKLARIKNMSNITFTINQQTIRIATSTDNEIFYVHNEGIYIQNQEGQSTFYPFEI